MTNHGEDRRISPALPKARLPRAVLPKAMALLLGCMLGCSDDSGDGAAGTAGAGGSTSAGGGTGGSLAAGGSGGSSGASAGVAGGSAATGGGGISGSGGSGSGGRAGSDATVSLDAGAGLGGTESGGDIQRCEGGGACLEFRGHDPACQETNVFNCSNVLNGTYSQGPCPSDYELVEVEETFCGPTATFLRPAP